MSSGCFRLEDIIIEVRSVHGDCLAGFHAGDRFSVADIIPAGYCPYMYHSTTPYLDAMENEASFRQKENYIVITCPNPKVSMAVKVLGQKHGDTILEVLSKNSDCPYYDLKIGDRWQVSRGKRIFCRQAFDSIFPYLSTLSSKMRTGHGARDAVLATCPGYPDFVVFRVADDCKTKSANVNIDKDFVKIKGGDKMGTAFAKKNILITGAAHGIGAALANLFAKEGGRVCLVDIDGDKLKETASAVKDEGGDPIVIIKDLSKAGERESVFSAMAENGFDLDILVNNVGVGFWGHFNDTPWEKTEEIIDVNIKCMTHMTKLALPAMLARNSGHIVNMASTAAFIGSPNGVCYSGTKAYIRIFSESLEMELVKTGIKVTCVFPGATETHFWQYAGMVGGKYDKNVDKMSSAEVAKEAIAAVQRGKSTVITGRKNLFNMLVVKFLPRELLKKVALKRFDV